MTTVEPAKNYTTYKQKYERLREACSKSNEEICQELGKALGYPWFKDDQKNFPGSTEEHGVCVGDHVAESLAAEAASKIVELREKLAAAEAHIEYLYSLMPWYPLE